MIRNPGAFYFRATNNDWTTPQNADLWQDVLKTLFDPCPAGWRVPREGEGELSPWYAFSSDNSVWNGAAVHPLGGRRYDATVVHGSSSAWYPASGFREASSLLTHGGGFTHNWPSTAGFQFHANASGVFPEYRYEGRSRSYSVRCVRE